jgi:uncharacterized lipoprotein
MKKLIGLIASLSMLIMVAGCQSNSSTARTNSDDARSASMRTPEGDRLDQPIPYPHYPYDIARGGGGGSTR